MSHPTEVHEEEESKKSCSRYKEIIETLPKEERSAIPLDLYKYQGFWYPHCFLESIMLAQEQFKVQPTDIFICSYPKTGATWVKALTTAILTRNHFGDLSNNPLLSRNPHEYIPFLEGDVFNRDPNCPLLATHMSYGCLPKSILESGCKIIYICRDPKDSFVSSWHFNKNVDGAEETEMQICFETHFERFCQGKLAYGPFWDHVLEFWNAHLECPERVLFLKYEDMKKDTLFHVRRLAQFINKPFLKEEVDGGVPQKIMEFCSLSNLSSLEVNKTGKYRTGIFTVNNSTFFRKGEVEDWKNHLTKEMMDRMNRISKQKFDGSGLTLGVSSPTLS